MSATPKQPELRLVSNSETMPLEEFAENAYLNYSMYVILDRALPHIADGLKPVQRRIIYAMSELGLSATAKFKKSARTVGDVIGKFHPHGDGAAYESMVLMAQPFSYRYPIIEGQGNWGSTDDPKSFAAMRYTECRFTRYAKVLLDEISKGTVDWIANFDNTLKEPIRLPAKLPNILLNGASGIAVGMATDIPSHNIKEVSEACIHLLKHPNSTIEQLCEIILGPDFPTEAEIITPASDILSMYKKGNGSVRQRAIWTEGPKSIVISALPYQVSGSKVMEQIATQMLNKKLPMIIDLRDEGDESNPIRLVLELRNAKVDREAVMSHLFATTDLERSIRINLNMIGLEGQPKVHDLKQILSGWLTFRTETTLRRLNSRFKFLQDRLHILDGLFVIFLNLDHVIFIIRNEDDAKQKLMKEFALSERQVEAVLEIRLRQLAKLEELKIREEQFKLRKERDEIQGFIESSSKLKSLIIKEIEETAAQHNDERRSPIRERETAQAFSTEQITPSEPITVILSKSGWIRAAKGHEINPLTLNYKEGDEFGVSSKGKSNESLICMDRTGRIYTLQAHGLPSARSLGEPLTTMVNPPPNSQFTGLLLSPSDKHVLLASSEAFGFICPIKQAISKSRSGKAVLTVNSGYSPLPIELISSLEQTLVVITSGGRILVYPVNDLPVRSKGKGVKMINIPKAYRKKETLLFAKVVSSHEDVFVHCGKRYLRLKRAERKNYFGERTLRGMLLPKGYQKVSQVEVRPN